MISRIEGELLVAQDGRVELRCGSVTYEVLVPACDLEELPEPVGETTYLFTLHYLEAQGQGASFLPRLIGFRTAGQRAFFELFTTVKGVGNRKALRAMVMPHGAIAEAIATKDLDLLVSLPEIGRRTAETIVAELHGKVDGFVEMKPLATEATGAAAASGLVHDAVAVLVQLGEPRQHARRLAERALAADPAIDAPEVLVAAALRLKELR
ncbi:MAG: Holliday junction branch migration protein RuvA [Planctomycetota bacterium]|jgi:Holliday junction DNA helicase RuvA